MWCKTVKTISFKYSLSSNAPKNWHRHNFQSRKRRIRMNDQTVNWFFSFNSNFFSSSVRPFVGINCSARTQKFRSNTKKFREMNINDKKISTTRDRFLKLVQAKVDKEKCFQSTTLILIWQKTIYFASNMFSQTKLKEN